MASQRVNQHNLAHHTLSSADINRVHEIIQVLSSAISPSQSPAQPTTSTDRHDYSRPSNSVINNDHHHDHDLPGPSSTPSQPLQSSRVVSSRNASGSAQTADEGDNIPERCDSALSALQRARASLNLQGSRRTGARYSQLFLHTTKRRRDSDTLHQKRYKTVGWTHSFYCLSECQQNVIPCSNYERDALLEAGLGEKRVFIPDIDASGEEFRSILYEAFPKLKDAGGYGFGKGKANSKYIEMLSSYCLTSPKILRSRVGNARTYIIPLQRSLSLSAVLTDVKSNVFEKCLLCMEEVPLHGLNDHLAKCVDLRSMEEPSLSSNDDDDQELPSANHVFSKTEVEHEGDDMLANDGSELPVTLKAALEEISGRVQETVEYTFEVRRDHILEDCFRNVSSNDFNPANRIQAVFLGEEAEDVGGPRRELWRLFELAVKNKYFEGNGSQVIPRHDTIALQSNIFYKIGVLIATSIAQGGSGFPHMYKGVYDYLCGKEPNSISIAASVIPDYAARSAAEKIIESTTDEGIRTLVTEYVETIVESGFTKAPMTITLKDKEDIIKALCLHHIILKCKAELDQLKEGLRVLGVATAIEVIPETFQSLFTASEETLTPDKLKQMFQGNVIFSNGDVVDSIKIAKEHVIYTYFCEYLEDCFKGDNVASLEEVLMFFSGAGRVPPGGFDCPPTITFDHESVYPRASTCVFKLILPAKHDKYDSFKGKMEQALKENGGFGYI